MMAQKMGRLKKGGIPDVEKAAFKVVEDWNTGKIRSGRRISGNNASQVKGDVLD